MLATNSVLFPGPNHLLTTSADNPTYDYSPSANESSGPVVSSWLGPGNRTFLEAASMVVTIGG